MTPTTLPPLLDGRWFKVPHALLQLAHEQGLTATDRMVLVALLSHKRSTYVVYPGIDRLRQLTGASESGVKRSLKSLCGRELIGRSRDRGSAGRWANNYYDLRPLFLALASAPEFAVTSGPEFAVTYEVEVTAEEEQQLLREQGSVEGSTGLYESSGLSELENLAARRSNVIDLAERMAS